MKRLLKPLLLLLGCAPLTTLSAGEDVTAREQATGQLPREQGWQAQVAGIFQAFQQEVQRRPVAVERGGAVECRRPALTVTARTVRLRAR